MKITFDVELTPEEARRFFGLPDVAPVQEHLMQRVKDQVDAAADPAYLGKLASQMVVGGVQSMEALQKSFFELMSGAANTGAAGSGKRNTSKDD